MYVRGCVDGVLCGWVERAYKPFVGLLRAYFGGIRGNGAVMAAAGLVGEGFLGWVLPIGRVLLWMLGWMGLFGLKMGLG